MIKQYHTMRNGAKNMRWLDKLERRYGKYRIENLMLYIVLTMLCVYIMDRVIGVGIGQFLTLSRGALFGGQIWRLVTFIFIPPPTSILFVALALYFEYWVGSSLENAWGSFRFNVYFLCGMLGAILAALISGYGDNTYLYLSLFLAFAQLYPEQEILLFFILPVKVKWMGWLALAGYALGLIFAPWSSKLAVLFSLINFFLFFGGGFIKRLRDRQKYSSVRRNFREQMRQNQNRR